MINQVLTVSGTIQIADLKPQGNIKAGDTVVGTDGRMFTIASVDSSAGTALLSADYTDLTPSVSERANGAPGGYRRVPSVQKERGSYDQSTNSKSDF